MVQVICHALFTVELLLLRVSVLGHYYYCCSIVGTQVLIIRNWRRHSYRG